jgi:hypothetical protein
MMTAESQQTPSSKSDQKAQPQLRRTFFSGTALRLFITCWLIYSLHFATNTVREIYPALSLADKLSFDVSEYLGLHPDIFEIPGRGVFINNNPGASIIGAIPYVLARPIIDRIVEHVQRLRRASPESQRRYETIYPLAQEFHREAREKGFDIKFGLAAFVMQVFCMAPLSAFSVVVMFFVLKNLVDSRRVALLSALLYAFATSVFYRTAQLNQNLLVTHFAFFSFVILWRPWQTVSRPTGFQFLAAGLLAGWTVVLDYSGVVPLFWLTVYMLVSWIPLPKLSKTYSRVLYYFLGVTISLTVLLAYQWLSFGNPFLPAQHYMPAANFTDQGYRGMDWPQPDLLWKTAFGLRYGLFTSAPLLILALYIPGWICASVRIVKKTETWCILLFCLSFFIFCSANQYGLMQFNSGVRHVVPVTPFLFLIVAGVLIKMPAVLAVPFGIAVTYWSWCLAMYRDVEQGLGVLESVIHVTIGGFRLPWLTTLDNMGYLQSENYVLPSFIFCALAIWALWRVGNGRLPGRVGLAKL